MSILFLSNGYGEDTIAATIIKELKKKNDKLDVFVMPLVGEGQIYRKAGFEPVFSQKILPSGGLIPSGHCKLIFKDLKAGLLGLALKQKKVLRNLRDKISLTVAVGDLIPVIFGGLFAKKPQIFVGTAKSNYFSKYSFIERYFMKKYCKKVFPRDNETAQDLEKSGIPAEWVGNVMMDCIEITGEAFNMAKEEVCFGVLPGSRGNSPENLKFLLKVFDEIISKLNRSAVFLIALADSVCLDEFSGLVQDFNWQIKNKNEFTPLEVRGKKQSPSATERGLLTGFFKEKSRLILTQEKFGDVINCAKLVLGQAGTANEQAAGLGKPVVAFDENPEKLGWYRLRQKGLLGEALKVVKKDSNLMAEEVISLLNNSEEYNFRSKIGITRMGPEGGAEKIADYIIKTDVCRKT